ncbi:MAG: clan AA aspartic protease [SAR202 cluster bacterium]|nr:clan AA aspartic protease [SAR202 cluster bacterium]
MGTFSVPIEVGDLAGRHFVAVDALVDTGANYTAIPASILESLGVARVGYRQFELANNHIVEYPIGQARIRFESQELFLLVVFAEENMSPLLGATALEIFGLAVDPIHRRLAPVPALLK